MRTLVRIRTTDGPYALPVDKVREIRRAPVLIPFPGARADVAGLLERAAEEPLTVLSTLGKVGRFVVVIQGSDGRFGLLVEEVLAVTRVHDADIGPPPPGGREGIVVGTVRWGQESALLIDPEAIWHHLAS